MKLNILTFILIGYSLCSNLRLIVGGEFKDAVGDTTAAKIAKWDGNDWNDFNVLGSNFSVSF